MIGCCCPAWGVHCACPIHAELVLDAGPGVKIVYPPRVRAAGAPAGFYLSDAASASAEPKENRP